MITVILVRMVVYAAGLIIDQVCGNDQDNGGQQQPVGEVGQEFFHHQQAETPDEKDQRERTVVVAPVTMVQGIGTNGQCKQDHADLKKEIVNDIDPEKGQTGQEQREHGTVDRAGQRGPDT